MADTRKHATIERPGPVERRGPIESRGTVVIAKNRCKGCELCIPACPPAVLSMSSEQNAIGFAYPELAPGCTGCGACAMVCPDFCFEIYRYDEPVLHDASGQAANEVAS